MTRIFIAGYQHETNTFAPSRADWRAFNRGDGFPAYMRGQTVIDTFRGVNAPTGGFVDAATAQGWTLIPSCWAGATPSAHVTEDAFERIAAAMVDDLRAALAHGLDGIYLDLHGAAVAEHQDDSEGELLARLRAVVGDALPIVTSLDLHANVSRRMLALADAMVAYRTYPHVDMAATGERAAQMLRRRLKAGRREPLQQARLPFLIPLPTQSTWMEPARGRYALLQELDDRHAAMPSFCMGFPAADIEEAAPALWAYGEHARACLDPLHDALADPAIWHLDVLDAPAAVARAMQLAATSQRPVVVADTQDNAGAGADSNTTGMLHALRGQGAGQRFPGLVVLGMLYDEAVAAHAHAAGVGAAFDAELGRAVPLWAGGPLSDPPLAGRYTVRALADGRCTLKGPMMTGITTGFGPSALLELDGLLIAVVSGKAQLLDREMLRMLGVMPEAMRIVVVKSSNHFRADFTPIAAEVLVAKAAGPMAADPADLPWRKLPPALRRRV